MKNILKALLVSEGHERVVTKEMLNFLGCEAFKDVFMLVNGMFKSIPRLPASNYSELDMRKLLLYSFSIFFNRLDEVPVRYGFTKLDVESLTKVVLDWKS